MIPFADEFRLLWTVLLNGGLILAAWRWARRRGSLGALQAAADAGLIYFLVQYAAVALPGVLGCLSLLSMSIVAGGAIAWLWFSAGPQQEFVQFVGSASADVVAPAPRGPRASKEPSAKADPTSKDGSQREFVQFVGSASADAMAPASRGRRTSKKPSAKADPTSPAGQLFDDPSKLWLAGALVFAAVYLLGFVYIQRLMPPVATDALVYHLPMAVQWIQTHRLGIYPSWYWNPAASYSPGTGSTFMAWWMLLGGNDVFVRFVQIPPLLWLLCIVARICRLLGAPRRIAGLLAAAAVLSRPLFSESIIPKDDLYVTAFTAAAVLALAPGVAADRLGPRRLGAAIGFVLASKYTALLACPLFLFLVDSPFKARWKPRSYLVAIGLVAVMALPWCLRNIVLTGNPLYPVDVHILGLKLPGLFGVERDASLRHAAGVMKMLSQTYHSLPMMQIAVLGLGWAAALIACGRDVIRRPLTRVCVIGSAATLGLFLVTSPHHEVRYLFPMIVLWFAALSAPISKIPSSCLSLAAAIFVMLLSALTTFSRDNFAVCASLTGIAAVVSSVVVLAIWLQTRWLHWPPSRLGLIGAVAALLAGGAAYVQWHAYVQSCREYRSIGWTATYGPNAIHCGPGNLWAWVDAHVPPDAHLAYANTFFVYPLYGFEFTRHVEYAPVRRGLHDFAHFPYMGARVPGDLIVRRMTEVMNEDADAATWLSNLRAMHAEYVLIAKPDAQNPDLSKDPPELRFARTMPKQFELLYEDDAGVVYAIK